MQGGMKNAKLVKARGWIGFLTNAGMLKAIDLLVADGLGDKNGDQGGAFPLRLQFVGGDGAGKVNTLEEVLDVERKYAAICRPDGSCGTPDSTTRWEIPNGITTYPYHPLARIERPKTAPAGRSRATPSPSPALQFLQTSDIMEIDLHSYCVTEEASRFTQEGLGVLDSADDPDTPPPGVWPMAPATRLDGRGQVPLYLGLPHMGGSQWSNGVYGTNGTTGAALASEHKSKAASGPSGAITTSEQFDLASAASYAWSLHRHNSCLHVEPITGEVFQSAMRLQTMLRVRQSTLLPGLRTDRCVWIGQHLHSRSAIWRAPIHCMCCVLTCMRTDAPLFAPLAVSPWFRSCGPRSYIPSHHRCVANDTVR
jgi:hypothetical protein